VGGEDSFDFSPQIVETGWEYGLREVETPLYDLVFWNGRLVPHSHVHGLGKFSAPTKRIQDVHADCMRR
jgi:hypothetical protein